MREEIIVTAQRMTGTDKIVLVMLDNQTGENETQVLDENEAQVYVEQLGKIVAALRGALECPR